MAHPTGWQRNGGKQGTQLYLLTSLPGESHQRWVPVMVGPLLTLTSPNLSSICLAPAASGKFPWDQGSSFSSSGDRCGVWAQRRREGLPCLGPRKEGSCCAWEPPSWAWASIHVPNIAASPVQSLRY